jgi:hypothetical protein
MEEVNPLKRLRSWTLANTKIAMLEENYPDKTTEDAHQESGQWLTKAADNHRLGSRVKLKATDA